VNITSLRVFGAIFALLALAFLVHLALLASGSSFSFVWNIEQAKDVSTGLGLFSAIFSGFAAFGLLYTISLQNESHKLQNRQIQQGAALQVRMLHFELLKLSINDKELEKVWVTTPAQENLELSGRQSMYANLILSHWEMMYTNNLMTEQQLKDMLSERMGGLLFMFWETHRIFRRRHATQAASSNPSASKNADEKSNKNLRFHEIVDDIFKTKRNGQLDMSLQSNVE